jgi:hypothetical protein
VRADIDNIASNEQSGALGTGINGVEQFLAMRAFRDDIIAMIDME